MKKYGWLALAVVALDQFSKALSARMQLPIVLIPHVLGLRCAQNTGMAFSLLSGQPWLLGVMSLLLMMAGWLFLRRYRLGAASKTAAMLMLGGAAGNMLDRLFRGYVVDMIEVLFVHFAIFNVADVALCIGCGLMAWSLIKCPKDWEKAVSS